MNPKVPSEEPLAGARSHKRQRVETSPKSGRRGFLGGVVALATSAAAVRLGPGRVFAAETPSGTFSIQDQDPWKNQTRRLKIARGGKPVASLIFPTDYPTHFRLKPELHGVCSPSGVPVTGSHEYCFIHHQSIMCGHGKVQVDGDSRVVDFYRQLPFPDAGRDDIHHRGSVNHNLYQIGPSGMQRITDARWRVKDHAVIRLELAWQTREIGREKGDTLVVEERFYRIAHTKWGTVIDLFSKLTPAGRALTLVPENDHGYIGMRVHDLIDVDDGGVMRDSEGRDPNGYFRVASNRWNPKSTANAGKTSPPPKLSREEGERREPRWVDCTGRIGDATVGLTLMSHPANVRNEWYAREFGLIIVSAAQSGPVRVTAEKPFEFAARFVAHDGPLMPEAADRLHAEFATVRADELRTFVHSG